MAYAEVIGDPVGQSKSPAIHKYWLERLSLAGDYYRTRVTLEELKQFFERRRSDGDWRGCNVTIPHKEAAAALVDRIDPPARAIGAVNCVVREGNRLIGHNTDIDGISAALGATEVSGRKAAIVGAGGAARAAVAYLGASGIGELAVLARNPEKAKSLKDLLPDGRFLILPFESADLAFRGADMMINASPLGMAGAPSMPSSVLDALSNHACRATVFDMVTTPSRTRFIAVGEEAGGRGIDGLEMLVGQAARAFELFFGAPAPDPDRELRDILTSSGSV